MNTPRPFGAPTLGDALSNAGSPAWAAPASASAVAEAARQVDCRWLLALYAVIPLSLAFVAIDSLFLEQALLNSYLPSSPTNWAFWAVIFGLPHIVASLLTMADREYVAHYRRSLAWPLLIFAAISVLGIAGPQPLSYRLLFFVVAVYTAYHVLAQQLGLTLMMMNMAPSRAFKAWKWIALASGISICGVSAAIATGGAIRARPAVPVVVSSLVVIFAVVEVLILPFLAQTFLSHEPLVAGAWLGLAIKTDGAAVASSGITESLILAKAAAEGVNYQPGWILGTTTTVKIFIDIFIGIWAFVLGYIWTNYIDVRKDKAKASEIWQRFPKFIIGFVVTFAVGLILALGTGPAVTAKLPAAIGEANTFRVIFFILTFFSIGVLSNFKRLWAEGVGKLAAVYFVSLFGFVIWVGLLISWVFFAGVKPPLAS